MISRILLYISILIIACQSSFVLASNAFTPVSERVEGFVSYSEIAEAGNSASSQFAQVRQQYEIALQTMSLEGLTLSNEILELLEGNVAAQYDHPSLAGMANRDDRVEHFLRSSLLSLDFIEAVKESTRHVLGGGLILDSYDAGRKHILSLKMPFGNDAPLGGGSIALLFDLDDLIPITGEGQGGWVSYWVDASLSVSASIPLLPGVGVFAIQRSDGIDDPLRRFRFTALSAEAIGFDIQFGTLSHEAGHSWFSYGGYAPTTTLAGVSVLETSATLLRGETDRGLVLLGLGSALMNQSGLVDWNSVITDLLDDTFSFSGLFSYFTGLMQPQLHRSLTASDNPGTVGQSSPLANTLFRANGGFDVDGDRRPDNVYAPSGTGSTPESFQSLEVSFYSDDSVQYDYKVVVEDVPPGWVVVSEYADGTQASDFSRVRNAHHNNTAYGTLWQVGCAPNAPSPVEVEFTLRRQSWNFFFYEVDGFVETFVCEDFVPDTAPSSYTLNIHKTGAAVESVISMEGLGTVCDASCSSRSIPIEAGTSVELTADGGTGADFYGWGGDCAGGGTCTIFMNESKYVTAAFGEGHSGGQPPPSPFGFEASAVGHDQIALSWQADSSNTHGFRVQRKNMATGGWFQIKSLPAASRAFTNVSLDPATLYQYRIYAYNEHGTSGFSNIASGVTDSNAPNAPAGFYGWAVSDRRVAMTWSDTNNANASYQVEQSSNGSDWSLVAYVGTGKTNYVRSVSPNSTTFFRVRAYNSTTGYSNYSSEIQIYACAPPAEPWLQRPLSGQGNQPLDLTFEWRGDDQVSTWDLYLGEDEEEPGLFESGIGNPDPGSRIEHDVFGLEPGTTYYWSVVAHSSCNTSYSTPGRIRAFRTEGAPDVPELISPADGLEDVATSTVLDWRNVTSLGTVIYEVHLGEASPPEFFQETLTRTELLVEGLEPDSVYYWQIVARSESNPDFFSESSVRSFSTGQGSTTTLVLLPTDDAGLRGPPHGNRNYGGDPDADAEQNVMILGRDDNWYVDPGAADVRGAIKFDLSSIPSGSDIQNATLSLPWIASYGPGLSSPLTMTFTPFTGSWGEQSITWNNRPGTNASHMVVGELPLSGFNPTDNDTTELVQKWLDGVIGNHGVEIAIPEWEGSAGNYYQVFAQKELPNTDPPSMQVTFSEPCVAPQAPSSPLPVPGSSGVESPVELSWDDSENVSGYDVFFGIGSDLEHISLTTETSVEVSSLLPGQQYQWKIEARATCDPSVTSTSPVWSFTTDSCLDLNPAELIGPENESAGAGRNVVLEWLPVGGATQYEVLVGTNPNPSVVFATESGLSSTVSLQPSSQYYWQIKAIPSCESAEPSYSEIRLIETAAGPSAIAGQNTMISPNQPINVGGDPSADFGTPPYQYTWSMTPSAGATLSSTTAANPIFEAQVADVYTLTLTVTDANGFVSAPSSILISIDPLIFSDGFESEG